MSRKSTGRKNERDMQASPMYKGSPGSPTVGGILNTNGDRVTYVAKATKSRKSLASSFKSRRSDYSMHDYRTGTMDISPT